MEMSFAGEEEVMKETEQLLKVIWQDIVNENFPENFPRMTYHDAMAFYGSDKPDLWFDTKVGHPDRPINDIKTNPNRSMTLPNT